MKVFPTFVYERHARKLLTPDERADAEVGIALAPERWPVIPGTGGARKARISRAGMGKRGGARLIYFVMTARGTLYLLDVYAKNRKENLTDADKKELRSVIEALKAEA